jgi:hypothetical protein
MIFRTARVPRAHEARGDARGPEEYEIYRFFTGFASAPMG